jgi:hypothetical protein
MEGEEACIDWERLIQHRTYPPPFARLYRILYMICLWALSLPEKWFVYEPYPFPKMETRTGNICCSPHNLYISAKIMLTFKSWIIRWQKLSYTYCQQNFNIPCISACFFTGLFMMSKFMRLVINSIVFYFWTFSSVSFYIFCRHAYFL